MLSLFTGVIGIFILNKYKYNLLAMIFKLYDDRSTAICDDNHIKISYIYGRDKYNVYLPYSHRNIAKMIQLKAELICDDKIVEITQQPGIPYLMTAKDLGGNIIKLTNFENGLYHEYTECPLYGKEIMD